MPTMRGWLGGVTGSCVVAAAAVTLWPPVLPVPAPSRAFLLVPEQEPELAATQSPRHAEAPRREPATSVVGTVVDETGTPIAGVPVAMAGCDEPVVSAADGSFGFRGGGRRRCRALPWHGWLAVESPLLALCSPLPTPRLVVVRAAQFAGRVVDERGMPVAGAYVAVELQVVPGAGSPARSVQIADAWSTMSDTGGWYSLPNAPIGPNAVLVVAHEGFAPARVGLAAAHGSALVTLAPAEVATAAVGTMRVPGGQRLDGWLLDDRDLPLAGWWAAAVPTEADADRGGPWGRFAAPPVRLGADARFTFDELPGGSYRIDAWTPDNRRVAGTGEVEVPAAGARLCAREPVRQRRVQGRVVDQGGRPVAYATVGFGRPTGWAVPGRLGMHLGTAVATDREGRFALAPCGLAALDLRVDGAPVVPLAVALAGDGVPMEIRVVARRWLGNAADGGSDPWAVAGTTLVAVDAGGALLPIWVGDSPGLHMACDLAGGGPFGFPAAARGLVLRTGAREVARLWLH